MLDMKITSTGRYYVTFKSIFACWDILKSGLKESWKNLLRIKTTSSEGYYAILMSIFAFWEILEHGIKRVEGSGW